MTTDIQLTPGSSKLGRLSEGQAFILTAQQNEAVYVLTDTGVCNNEYVACVNLTRLRDGRVRLRPDRRVWPVKLVHITASLEPPVGVER